MFLLLMRVWFLNYVHASSKRTSTVMTPTVTGFPFPDLVDLYNFR